MNQLIKPRRLTVALRCNKKAQRPQGFNWLIGWIQGFKVDCLTGDLGLWVGTPSMGVFLRGPSPFYASLGENHGKLQTARWTSMTGH